MISPSALWGNFNRSEKSESSGKAAWPAAWSASCGPTGGPGVGLFGVPTGGPAAGLTSGAFGGPRSGMGGPLAFGASPSDFCQLGGIEEGAPAKIPILKRLLTASFGFDIGPNSNYYCVLCLPLVGIRLGS